MFINIYIFRSFITKLLIFCAILEICFFFSWPGLFAIFSISINWIVAYYSVFKKRNMKQYPLSTFILIGYCVFFIIMPMPATLLELKPIIYNLKNPIETFTHITLIFLVLNITFIIYKKTVGKHNPFKPLFYSVGLYRKFTSKEIWVLTVLALVVTAISILFFGRWQSADTKIEKPFLLELLSSYGEFINLPLLFLFPSFQLVKNQKVGKRWIIFLYAVVLFVIGIASNVRTMAVSFISLGLFVLFFVWLLDLVKIKLKIKYFILIFLAVYFFTGPFADLSIAMVMIRGEKTDISGIELLKKTLSVYNDKEEIRLYKKLIKKDILSIGVNDWDETYIDNDLLTRFCSVKTIDETIYYAGKIGYGNTKMQIDYEKQIIAMLPAVICEKLFNMKQKNRDEIKGYSETDYLYSLANKNSNGLGSFKIGSLAGIGLSIFGYWYLLSVMVLFFILFILFDSTILIKKNGRFNFSLWAFCNILLIAFISQSGHNFHTEVRYIIRGFWESIGFYLLCIFVFKSIKRISIKK